MCGTYASAHRHWGEEEGMLFWGEEYFRGGWLRAARAWVYIRTSSLRRAVRNKGGNGLEKGGEPQSGVDARLMLGGGGDRGSRMLLVGAWGGLIKKGIVDCLVLKRGERPGKGEKPFV